VTQMFERMLRCCDELGKTLQPRLVLDCALIDVATIEPLVPLGDLLERLSELEARLAGKAVRAGAGGGGGSKDRPRAPSPAPASRPMASSAPPLGAPGAPGGRSASPPAAAPALSPPVASSSPVASSPSVASPSPVASSSLVASSPSVASSPPVASSSPVPSSSPVAPRSSAAAPAAPASPPPSAAPAAVVPAASAISSPVSMQPSGPVPKLDTVASGSGPHDGEPPPAGLAIPANPAEALKSWNEVLSELEALRKFSLLGPFQHARVMSWTADALELGFPVDAHSMGEMARDSVDELRAIVRNLGPAQKAVRVSVRLLDAGESNTAAARSVLETTRERTSAERNKRESEAREHPITKHVLQTFGAQIKEIKTDV